MHAPANRDSRAPRPGRIFIALWPPADVAAEIVRRTTPCVLAQGGRALLAADLHLTLAFLGVLGVEQIAAARAAFDACDGRGVALPLEQLGCFERAAVLWIAPARPPAALTEIHESLWRELAAAGFEPERRRFKPHITFARRARPMRAQRLEPPIDWRAETLALATSASDANAPQRYDQLAVRKLTR